MSGHGEIVPHERKLEMTAAIVLALATVATAWAAYQAREWTGKQSQAYSQGTAARITENRAAALADRQVQIDVATFIQWVDARAHDDSELARFYRQRFRDEFKPAFAAWLAARPLRNPAAPATPFELPSYKLAATAEAERLEATAAAASARAQAANEHAGDELLAVVLFASALFFAGISAKFHVLRVRVALLALGCVVFAVAAVWLATVPVA